MILQLYTPCFPLNQFIENFLYYKDYDPVHSLERLLPDGNINVVIDLTDCPKFIYDNETLKQIQSCRNVWFSGMRNNYITIPSGRNNEMFVINFHKGKAYPFVEMPVHELTDYVVDGELVMSNKILNLREALLNTLTINGKFIYAEQYLLKNFGGKLCINPYIDYAVKQILSAPHQTTINYLTHKVGYSQKHLIKIFKEHVGLTPKGFLKIIRFQKAISDIETNQTIKWTSIAYESGYYDQAHFINDFKKFSGLTPEQFLKTKTEYTNYVAVG